MEDTLSLDDLFGDHFFTPEGDAVFFKDDDVSDATWQSEIESAEHNPFVTQEFDLHEQKIHVIDPTSSCDTLSSVISKSAIPVSTKNAVFPKRQIKIEHTNYAQPQVRVVPVDGAPAGTVTINRNNNQGANASNANNNCTTHNQPSTSVGEALPTSILGCVTTTKAPTTTVCTAGHDIPKVPTMTASTMLAPKSAQTQLSQSQGNYMGVFNPITGLFTGAGRTAMDVMKTVSVLPEPVSAPAPVVTLSSTNTKSQKKRRLQHDVDIAPRDKDQPMMNSPSGAQVGEMFAQVENERRVRNREHAKRSRLRKKALLESLQSSVKLLREENKKLRNSIRQNVGDNQADALFTKQNLSQILANVTSKNITQSDPPNPAIIRNKVFNYVKSSQQNTQNHDEAKTSTVKSEKPIQCIA